MHGMILVHFEVRRTMHMAELWALFMPPKSLSEPAAFHNDNMGFLDGFWKGEDGPNPMQKEAPVCIKTLAPAPGSRQEGCATRR